MSFYNYRGHLIHYKYLDQGKEQTLVFINSLGTDFRIWDSVAGNLFPVANLLLFDKRGHGLSGLTPSPKGLEDYTEDLVGLLQYLDIRQQIIPVGLSVGGIIAQLLINRIPDQIPRVILSDTRYKIGNSKIWNDRIAQVRGRGIGSISDGVVGRWFSKIFHARFPETVLGYKYMLERTPVDGYIQTCEGIRDADTAEIARKIAVPALCLVGAEDQSTTPEEVKNLADLIPGSVYLVLENSGHLPCIDNAATLSRLISEFIQTS